MSQRTFMLSVQLISIIQARSSPLKKCDGVCTQRKKKLFEDILASLGQEKCGLEKGV